MSSLFQIVYTSTAARDFSRAELRELVGIFVERNARADITGVLLYKYRRFMQVLEGTEEAVIHLFAKISHDQRHHRILPLSHAPIERRYFPNSAMAFLDLDSPGLQSVPGYSQFLNALLSGERQAKDMPECPKLLFFMQDLRGNFERADSF